MSTANNHSTSRRAGVSTTSGRPVDARLCPECGQTYDHAGRGDEVTVCLSCARIVADPCCGGPRFQHVYVPCVVEVRHECGAPSSRAA